MIISYLSQKNLIMVNMCYSFDQNNYCILYVNVCSMLKTHPFLYKANCDVILSYSAFRAKYLKF